jgi:hypothetical protein
MKKHIFNILILTSLINIAVFGQQLHRAGLLFEDISKNPLIKKAEHKAVLHKIASYADNSAHLPPVGDQGQQGSCVAWAFGYYYKTYQEWQEHGWSVTDPNHIFSPAFIYNHIDGGNDGGSYFSDAMQLLMDNGCATIAEFPYKQSDFTSWPSESVYLDALNYRALDGYYIGIDSTKDIEQVKELVSAGNMAILGIFIYGNFDNINNFNNIYCVKDKTGDNRGGHALAIVGYDDNIVTADGKGAFRLVNQWGSNWGDSGFCWMSYQAVMDKDLSQRIVCYTSDRIQYKPTLIASVQVAHPDRNLLNLTVGIGKDHTPAYSINCFDFYMCRVPGQPVIPYPNNKIIFDLSDGLNFIDTVKDNNVFLAAQSTVAGTVSTFSVTDLRVHYTTASTETPKTVPDNNDTTFTNIDLKIVKSNIISKNVPVMRGWNIVSVPVISADMSTVALFPNTNSSSYNYNNKYDVASTLGNGNGYWVSYPDTATVTINGSIVNGSTIPITAGWNLIGIYESNVRVDQITTSPWSIINSPFYGYNGKYEIPSVLEVGKGYWVRASEAGELNIGNALAKAANKTMVQGNIDSGWVKIIVQDARGNQKIIYGASGVANFDSFALPPLPPNGVFDIRWDSGQLVDDISTGTKNIFINSAVYPVTLKVTGGNLDITDLIGGTIINKVLTNGQSLTITNQAIGKLKIKTAVLPSNFALYQNYPNPFNPETIINYSIPKTSFVTIKVYDIIGNEVANLVNEQKTAGNYNVKFSAGAKHLASGVYFYRMKADGFTETKKLLLLK